MITGCITLKLGDLRRVPWEVEALVRAGHFGEVRHVGGTREPGWLQVIHLDMLPLELPQTGELDQPGRSEAAVKYLQRLNLRQAGDDRERSIVELPDA
jgi:hypothetical protein